MFQSQGSPKPMNASQAKRHMQCEANIPPRAKSTTNVILPPKQSSQSKSAKANPSVTKANTPSKQSQFEYSYHSQISLKKPPAFKNCI